MLQPFVEDDQRDAAKNHIHLIDVCRTRWVAMLDGLGVFIELYPAIIASIEVIKDNAERTCVLSYCLSLP